MISLGRIKTISSRVQYEQTEANTGLSIYIISIIVDFVHTLTHQIDLVFDVKKTPALAHPHCPSEMKGKSLPHKSLFDPKCLINAANRG